MADPLCLLSVHAHPDDEASKGAGTIARYHAAGVHTVLVCCTGGEAGEILNPAMDRPEVRADLPRIRIEELRRSAETIGYDELVLLGYRDSGMPGTDLNSHPDSFAQASLEEAAGKLVEVLRRTRPQVILTYSDEQTGYPHPDHLRVHDVSVAAFEAAGDGGQYPDAGPAWEPLKLYYHVWSRARMRAMHEKFGELGLESPFDEEWFRRPDQDHRITTRVDVSQFADVRRDALLAHATQVDPQSKFWFGIPHEVARTLHPYEEYILARSVVRITEPEDDLFAGVRAGAEAKRS